METKPSKTSVLFPGQGPQSHQMLDGVKSSRDFSKHYEILKNFLDKDPITELAAKNDRFLNQNRVSSLLTVFTSTQSFSRFIQDFGMPDFAAGYSVGQWTALWAADCLNFEELLRVISKRAELMDSCLEGQQTGMVAVIGLGEKAVRDVCEEVSRKGQSVWVSNINCLGQYSISGSLEALENARLLLDELKPKKLVSLPVAGAWHSAYLNEAATRFHKFLARVPLQPPRFPVIDNVTGQWLPTDMKALKVQLAKHLSHSVQWEAGIRHLRAAGAERLVEVGFGNMLTKYSFFIDRNCQHLTCY